MLTNTYTTALTTKQVAREVLFPCYFNRAYSIITNKDDLTKENARIKQLLKENGYQESIISNIFKTITNNPSLSQSQQQTQATDTQEKEIRTSINLPYAEGISERLWHNNIVHEICCSNCEAVYLGESKRSLKSRSDERKRSIRNCDCEKNKIVKHCWEADQNFS